MAEAQSGQVEDQKPQETPEERDARNAAAYRAQLDGGVPADKVDDKPNKEADDKPQRPAHVPEKFWDAEKGEVNVEALAKSYTELEKAKAKPAEEDKRTPEEKAADEKAETDSKAQFAKYREGVTEKITKGEALTDADYAPAEKMGLSREDVDTFIAGLQAIGQLHAMSVYKEAGGEEQYKSMIEWAREAYTPEEIAAYDRDVHSQDKAVSLNAVRGLAARHALANGRPASKDVTTNGSGRGSSGYKSGAEMRADMRDPKYAKDPAFRAQVAMKVKAARAAGVDLTQ